MTGHDDDQDGGRPPALAALTPLLEPAAVDGKAAKAAEAEAAADGAANNNKTADLEDLYRDLPLTEDTTCGIGFIRGPWLQRFATKNVYVLIYGLLGCIFSASYAYSNGIITTLEKRFKIPSKTIGVITVGNDFTQLFVSVFLSYYAGKGHRPRWIAFGIYTVVLYCLLTALPHLMYGPGEDSLTLTVEHGAVYDRNASREERDKMERKVMCATDGGTAIHCDSEEGNLAPVAILFLAQLVSGIGGSLYYTIGVSYMDDNIKKDKTPALISFSYFLRMLGPCIGYALASFCLKLYISPTLTPTIDNTDPRWLGAWWLGWIVLAVLLFLFASVLGLFPRTLPKAAARRAAQQDVLNKAGGVEAEAPKASIKDMLTTFKRLMQNPTLMCNNAASVFYFFGYMPYWIYMPKYIETQYRQSASSSSLVTGTVGIVFSGFGILLSGLVITKYRPNARQMALWNTLVGLISAAGIISYIFLGCPDNDSYGGLLRPNGELETAFQCNSDCSCEYVKYSPVCASDGYTTYISACHAGCRDYERLPSGAKVYKNCSCIAPILAGNASMVPSSTTPSTSTAGGIFGSATYTVGGTASPGACPVDCSHMFYMFLAVVCILKFSGATGRATNFLVSVRCVEEKDKPVAMGLGITLMSLFAFMPSPIFFGYIMDATCLVWGKTCSGNGNCWLYNGESLRYLLNLTSAGFVLVGTMFDAGVWYFVKNVQIFDDEDNKATGKPGKPTEQDGCELEETANQQFKNNIKNHINQGSDKSNHTSEGANKL